MHELRHVNLGSKVKIKKINEWIDLNYECQVKGFQPEIHCPSYFQVIFKKP